MKILTIIGARPQFIKCAPVSDAINKKHEQVVIHTGQHYDDNLSSVFFKELNIPIPNYNLGVGSGSHGEQTAKMILGIEKIIMAENPDMVLVYGDTNSTLAGALVASKLHIQIAHVEAGLRSFDMHMPEEINRVLTDKISNIRFCPTKTSLKNLENEKMADNAHMVGDVMYDALITNNKIAEKKSTILRDIGITSKNYSVATIHRASNTDKKENLQNIVNTFCELDGIIVFPVHPRTIKYLKKYSLYDKLKEHVILTNPLGYLDFLKLMNNAKKILTDSGGIQKEAYMLNIPCITLRDTTEWVETLEEGWNILVGTNRNQIIKNFNNFEPNASTKNVFGDGNASKRISEILDGCETIS